MTNAHRCHWPGCQAKVPPRLWGCRPHWTTLPVKIRDAILRAYVHGQEDRKDPSPAYLEAAAAAQTWAIDWLRQRGVYRPTDAVFTPKPRAAKPEQPIDSLPDRARACVDEYERAVADWYPELGGLPRPTPTPAVTFAAAYLAQIAENDLLRTKASLTTRGHPPPPMMRQTFDGRWIR